MIRTVTNMQYTTIGNTKIPKAAIGTWSWGTGINGGNQIFGNHLHKEDLKPIYQSAIHAGLTLWDTAPVYGMGAAESILGDFIDGDTTILLSTKFMPLGFQRKNAMRKSLEKSLSRLGRKQADIFWIHAPKNVKKWTKELIPLMKRKKIKYAGVSNHNMEEILLAKKILEQAGLQLSAIQNHFSLLYRASERNGILEWCHKNNILFFSYMVLEQGALTGAYSKKHPFKNGTRRGVTYTPEVLEQLSPLIQLMKEIGKRYQASAADVATAWALSKNTIPIIGVTKPHHIESILNAMEIQLEESEIKKLEHYANKTGIEKKGFWEKEM